jgi:hypothetical protein
MAFAEVHIVVVRLTLDWNVSLKVIVRKNDFIFVNSRFLWNEFKNKLFRLSNLKDAFIFA